MKRQRFAILLWVVGLLWSSAVVAAAASPFNILKPFKRVEADSSKSYALRRENGPWVIHATSFSGEGAEQQARALMLELRKRYNLPAYLHRQKFNHNEKIQGLGVDRYGRPKQMRNFNVQEVEEISVLVGNYDGVSDPRGQKTLKKIKHIIPNALRTDNRNRTYQRYGYLREMQRVVSKKMVASQKGPMRRAMIVPNPLLPKEYFAPRGLDPLVVDMNKKVEHSLLNNRGKYSLRVATFRGSTTMKIKKIERDSKLDNKLDKAAVKAHRLTVALRKLGYEAFEFHDRHESIVTVGSFQAVGQPRSDGKTEINPALHRLMQTFTARTKNLPGLRGAVVPHIVDGVVLDAQPQPVHVPRFSIATDYARSGILR